MKKIEAQILDSKKDYKHYLIVGIAILIAQTIYHLLVAQTFLKP